MNAQLKQGTLLHGGAYRIEQMLGQGSFGITYLAIHIALNKKVAIKEFFMKDINSRGEDGSITGMSDGSLSMNYARKFQKEALNLAGLEHPNIVRVTDSFEDNGTFYYVMDYIEGENLNEYLMHNRVSRQEAVDIIRDVAKALMYMHEKKHMLHLDLKPGNIMRRSSDGHIFLIDFGLSKHYSNNGQPETSTTIGLGTPGYAPIEQANQAKNGEFRPTIDVYALGATFYKLLTCETPPAASELVNDDELLAKSLKQHNINSKLSNVVINAMLPSAKKRTQSVKDFLASLDYEKKDTIVSLNHNVTSTTSDDTVVPSANDKEATIKGQIGEDDTITMSYLSFDTAMSYYNKGQYKTAFPILEKLANNGSANAMFRLGVCYYWDEGVVRSNPKSINFSKCFELMSKAASKGNTDAMLWLGSYLYSNGEGVSKDKKKSVEYIKKAADANNDSAKITLGMLYLTGENVVIDEERGSRLIYDGFKGLLKRAELLSREEMHVFATCYLLGIGVEENIQKAICWYKKSAELGDPEAQESLGEIYLYGHNEIPENKYEALKWFKLSSSKNLTGALKNTGNCYYHGWGTSQNFSEAILWYKKAAKEGDVDSMVSIGICYKNGQGVTQSYKNAENWFIKAKKKANDGNAIYCLGLIYEEGGYGIVKDQAKAARYYKEAALLNIAEAQYGYGMSLISGEGVAQNLETGIEWISKAADQNCQEAIDVLNYIQNSSEESSQPMSYAEENPRPMQKQRNESGCIVLFLSPYLLEFLLEFFEIMWILLNSGIVMFLHDNSAVISNYFDNNRNNIRLHIKMIKDFIKDLCHSVPLKNEKGVFFYSLMEKELGYYIQLLKSLKFEDIKPLLSDDLAMYGNPTKQRFLNLMEEIVSECLCILQLSYNGDTFQATIRLKRLLTVRKATNGRLADMYANYFKFKASDDKYYRCVLFNKEDKNINCNHIPFNMRYKAST